MAIGENPGPKIAARRNRNNESIRAFRSVAWKLLESAKERVRTSDNLDDKEAYAALCLTFISVTWDIRVLRDVLLFLGRIHGHDQQNKIVLEDPTSYRALIEELRDRQTKVIEAPVKKADVVIDVEPGGMDVELRADLEARAREAEERQAAELARRRGAASAQLEAGSEPAGRERGRSDPSLPTLNGAPESEELNDDDGIDAAGDPGER